MKFIIVIFVHIIAIGSSSSLQWPYLQIYPPVNSSDDRTPLYFAVVLSTTGNFPSIRALPGIQIALDVINNDTSILPGYTLHYTLTDSKCHTLGAANSFFRQVLTEPTKLAWIGSGCSVATESTAKLTPFYNLTQVSCASALTDNQNVNRLWRYYFQMFPFANVAAYGYISIILNFEWKRVSIITQNIDVYVRATDTLKEGLNFYGIKYSETIFTDVSDIGEATYDSDVRIYIWAVTSKSARELACEAHKRGLYYPEYQFLLPGLYVDGFLSDSQLIDSDCTEAERTKAIEYSLTVSLQEFDNVDNNSGIGGFTLADFRKELEKKYNDSVNEHLKLSNATQASPELCYEATVSVALALHNTLMDIESNTSLKHEAGREADIANFTLANFSYSNFAIVQTMFHHLSSINFRGINARRVYFNENGRRVSNTLQIGQYIVKGGVARQVKVGVVINASIEGFHLQILSADKLWPNGTPTDGMPVIQIITLYTSNIVIFSILGVIGIVYSLAYIIFNYIHRNKRIVRLSSPKLNYVVGVGALLVYSTLFILIVGSDRDKDVIVGLSILGVWVLHIGHTLFFGAITSKMIRVWYIFNNPIPKKKMTLKDFHLFGILAIFIAIDLFLLGGFVIIEGARGNLKVHLSMSAETPTRLIGPTGEVHEYYFYSIVSSSVLVWYSILGTERIIMGIIALVFAFRTRKVKLRGLDDSKFVIAATYAINIFSIPGIAGTLSSIGGYYNIVISVLGGNLFLSTTTILSLIFIPKIVALYKDPTGNNIGGINFVLQQPKPVIIQQPSDRETQKMLLRKKIETLETLLTQHMEDTAARP